MIVKAIDTYPAKDGSTRWKITLEGDDKPLILGWQPNFKVGDEIPDDKLKLTSKGDRQYYIWKKEGQRSSRHSTEDTPERAKSVCLSYAKDLCVAGKIELDDILTQATKFYNWIMKQ